MKCPFPVVCAALVLVFGVGCIGVSQTRRDSESQAASGKPKRCPHGVRPAIDGDMDDFEDGDNQLTKLAGRDGHWWTEKDAFGSTVSMMPDDGGAGGSEMAMHAMGTTTSGHGGDNWGAGIGVNFVTQGAFYDASKYAGVSFRAKAGPKASRQIRFKIADVDTHPKGKVCTQCWNHFGMDLTLTGDWREYPILFSEVQQEPGWGAPRPDSVTPSKLIALDWTIGPDRSYDLWIDDLVLLECKP